MQKYNDSNIKICIIHNERTNVNIKKEGQTVIQLAHMYGQSKPVELLLEHGADESSLQGLEFRSMVIVVYLYLAFACRSGFHKCSLQLLQADAIVDKPEINGCTSLYLSCMVGQLKCVVVLVEHGTNVNQCNINMTTLLMASAYSGKVNVKSYLITARCNGVPLSTILGSALCCNSKDTHVSCPFLQAASNGVVS